MHCRKDSREIEDRPRRAGAAIQRPQRRNLDNKARRAPRTGPRSDLLAIRRPVIYALALACSILVAPLAAGQLNLVGEASTQSLRVSISNAMQQGEKPLEVRARMTSRGQVRRTRWWQERNSVALYELGLDAATAAAIEREREHPPIALPVAATAVMAIVNIRNPLATQGLAVGDLRRIFSTTDRSQGRIRFWGDLGLPGAWKRRTVAALVSDLEPEAALIRKLLLDGAELDAAVSRSAKSARELMNSVDGREQAIALLRLRDPIGRVAVVPLRADVEPTSVAPTPKAIRNGLYPLSGCVFLHLVTAPADALDADAASLLEFLWSSPGQALFRHAGYVSLDERLLEDAREWLGRSRTRDFKDNESPPGCD